MAWFYARGLASGGMGTPFSVQWPINSTENNNSSQYVTRYNIADQELKCSLFSKLQDVFSLLESPSGGLVDLLFPPLPFLLSKFKLEDLAGSGLPHRND